MKHGHTVTLVGTHQGSGGVLEETDAYGRVILLPVQIDEKSMHRRVVSVTDVSAQLDAVLRKTKPDVVHAHNIHTYLTYDALCVARRHTSNVFLTVHDTFLVSFARVAGARYEADTLAGQPHKMHGWEHLRMVGRSYWPLRNWKIRNILRASVNAVHVYTHAMENFLKINGIPHVTYVQSGIDERATPTGQEILAFRKKHGLDGPCVLYGARISGDKGIGALLQAAELVLKSVPTASFLIIGDADRLAPYIRTIPEHVRRAIRPLPWIPYEELQTAYAASDVVTVPSLYLDNFPTITLEAMRAGRPVVGTCFGGTPEAIEDGVTGYVVNPRDTKLYAERLAQLLQDPALAERMGKAGQERIRKTFSIDRYVAELLALFQK